MQMPSDRNENEGKRREPIFHESQFGNVVFWVLVIGLVIVLNQLGVMGS